MPIYEVSQHPLVDRSRNPNGRILIAMVDSTVSGMKAALDLEQDKHMAKGSDDHLVAQGQKVFLAIKMCLSEGWQPGEILIETDDVIYLRDLQGERKDGCLQPEKDIFCLGITDGYVAYQLFGWYA